MGKSNKFFPVFSFKKPRPGIQTKIIKLKEGEYFWKEGIGYSGNTQYVLEMDPELSKFTVKSGKINYPGMLTVKGYEHNGQYYSHYNMTNNTSDLLIDLKKRYPSLLEKYELEYSGKIKDPFLELNREIEKDK